jgi:hypothetical protein
MIYITVGRPKCSEEDRDLNKNKPFICFQPFSSNHSCYTVSKSIANENTNVLIKWRHKNCEYRTECYHNFDEALKQGYKIIRS